MNELAPRPSLKGCPQYGLVSLWDMLSFKAEAFYEAVRNLERLQMIFEHILNDGNVPVPESARSTIRKDLGKFLQGCEILDAPLSLKAAQRLKERLENRKDLFPPNLSNAFNDIIARFRDEIEDKPLLVISKDDRGLFDNAVALFGDKVVEVFKDSVSDLEESGKCLALDRSTAAAFHLMRALEVPLQIFSKKLLPNDPRPNWDPIIRKIDEELKLPHKDRSIKGNVDFYSNVSAHLHAVKLAWRNRINHIDEQVSPEKARDIFSATKALMVYLAENLPDEMRPVAAESSS